jgi:ABC-type transport system substrate-binding protein
LAIDKNAIIKHLFMGFAQPIGTYPGPNIEGCGGRDSEPYPYDLKEARRLIREGGYQGFEFAVPNYSREGCSEFQEVVEAVCGYWEKVELKPKIFNTDYSSWRDKMMSGNSSGTVSGSNWTATPTCGENLTAYSVKFHSTMKGAYAKSPQLDQMIDKASSSLDEAEMEKLVRDLYRYIYDQHLWVFICGINEEMATARHVPK